ncbi:MFS multidrug transporter-like protein [Cucurbitaria berberidis CBS 394.84]|uniref:MFS multidrug transporter-like protein n=1 Tax=Cucurbitaria berberidis CBS 394.84 TaxID=1168544 RepID=A0A9P4GA55_9PLEO|nr:MFS multidrug transporter-like protein [Cucurbitaria berberidis CBS 394.84]KAF1841676.1 MFS multidrug transporter-like protein [Cucurbitaria berberidis CBS 394.84]
MDHGTGSGPSRLRNLWVSLISQNYFNCDDPSVASAGKKEATEGIEMVPTRSQSLPPTNPDTPLTLDEANAVEHTAYMFSTKKKWWILTVVALCQTSMNYNAAVYSNAIGRLNAEYNLGSNHFTNARAGMAWFLILYGFGCELWAPWSEEFGRKYIMQLSLGLVNLWQVLAGASNAWWMVLLARLLGGVCSAGGSVTLGMVADMFDPEDQQFPVLWVSLWSCLGSVIGGICGGPIEQYLGWRWNFWIQLIFGIVVQFIHLCFVSETRSTVMLNREAKRQRRQNPNTNVVGPTENEKIRVSETLAIMGRPFKMLVCEPIVGFLSLLSGFSDALIFSFLESYGYVFKDSAWNFTPSQLGIALFALFIGYWAAGFAYFPVIRRHNQQRKSGKELSPESRLWFLQYIVLLLPIGLFISVFTVTGPPVPWIAPLIGAVLIGCANMAIYYATIDYMVAAYGGKYSASATGGNGFSRDVLAGICSFYTGPMYHKLGVQNSTWVLFALSVVVCIPVFVIYKKGPQIRARSKYAKEIEKERVENEATKQAMGERRRALQDPEV